MIFETHAHYDDKAFDEDREELLSSMLENGIEAIVNVCANADELDRTAQLMDRFPFVYGAFGVHPDDAGKMTAATLDKIRALSSLPKAVAIGEIGLDYYWDKENHDVQKKWFAAQMEIARELKKPFIIHSRDAAADTLDMMKALHADQMSGGIVHCFSYSQELAREYLNMGLYLGIGGVVTFKNAKVLKKVVSYAPLSQLVLETDSPYLSPEPNRGHRNSSLNIPYIAQAIADLKQIPIQEVIETTNQNAKKLFQLS